MIKTDLVLPYKYSHDTVKECISRHLPITRDEIGELRILKRELVIKDGKEPLYKATVAFSASFEKENGLLKMRSKVSGYQYSVFAPQRASYSFRPVVIGAGPCGLFAALTLAESGAAPIILERGMPVDERRERIRLFETLGMLDTESNVQFGEGGAGAYSDGKLKVGARDPYKMKILEEFCSAGADESILYSTSAHLGTDKLPGIVKMLREKIISLGGEFIFGAKFTDFTLNNGELTSIKYQKNGEECELETQAAVIAIGHSARDTIYRLSAKGLLMTAKGFGVGVRIEHPREHIDKLVYRDAVELIDETASYHLVTHLKNGRSVYSFCMCPGGTVVAAASEEERIVTNGMSEYARMADNSNSALLVSVTPDDFGSTAPLAGIEFQRRIEEKAYNHSSSYRAPAEQLSSFMGYGRTLSGNITPSYPLGTVDAQLDDILPSFVTDSLRLGICDFDEWMNGYFYSGAVLTAPETRTTSPVRIERDTRGSAIGFSGLYPSGEGAGYAGGIVSSALDGIRTAERIIEKFGKTEI